MNWFETLLFGDGIPHSILILAIVIAIGIALGKIKIFGISLGITWILFVGIFAGHFGLVIDKTVMSFVKEFGLILFIFSLGLQVGPGFFSSFKKGGVSLNIVGACIVIGGCLTTYIIHIVSGTSLSTMIGVMSGAVTNTPGLGAAQQTFIDINGFEDPTIPMGYAVAYPLGVVGVIVTLILMKSFFKMNIDKEKELIQKRAEVRDNAIKIAVQVNNEAVSGKTIYEIDKMLDRRFVVSRLYHYDSKMEIPTSSSVISKGDKLLLITSVANEQIIIALFGKKIEMSQGEWESLDTQLISRRIVVTQSKINGRTLGELNLRAQYGINITRINRSGIDLSASPDLQLQLGDRVMVVGNENSINKVSKVLGDAIHKLREPNLIPIFLGIFLGVLLGSIPIVVPGIPQPIKFGLAGGPLIVAILIAHFGPKYKLVTYTTMSANMMLREIGISLFLAAVGIGAGEGFVNAILTGGYMWIIYGFIITIIPITIAAFVGRKVLKLDYFSLSGLICGSQTNPIALAFMNNSFSVSQTAVVYATVYPLVMFLRVLMAQVLILF